MCNIIPLHFKHNTTHKNTTACGVLPYENPMQVVTVIPCHPLSFAGTLRNCGAFGFPPHVFTRSSMPPSKSTAKIQLWGSSSALVPLRMALTSVLQGLLALLLGAIGRYEWSSWHRYERSILTTSSVWCVHYVLGTDGAARREPGRTRSDEVTEVPDVTDQVCIFIASFVTSALLVVTRSY